MKQVVITIENHEELDEETFDQLVSTLTSLLNDEFPEIDAHIELIEEEEELLPYVDYDPDEE